MKTHLPGRFDAIQKLHSRLSSYEPGTIEHEVSEHAIDLALNERREFTPYFYYDVIKDSKRILQRQQLRVQLVSLNGLSCYENEDGDSCDDGLVPEALWDYVTPELLLQCRELTEQIIRAVGGNASTVTKVLEGMVLGESLAESASSIGVSVVYVNKLRSKIRSSASKIVAKRRLQ